MSRLIILKSRPIRALITDLDREKMTHLYDGMEYPDENNIFQSPAITTAYADDMVRVDLFSAHYNGWHYGISIKTARGDQGGQCVYRSGGGLLSQEDANKKAAGLALKVLMGYFSSEGDECGDYSKSIRNAISACQDFAGIS